MLILYMLDISMLELSLLASWCQHYLKISSIILLCNPTTEWRTSNLHWPGHTGEERFMIMFQQRRALVGHLLAGWRLIQKLSIPMSDDPNPRKCLYILARPQCEKESLWIGCAGLELWGSTELVLEYLLPPVRCYSFNVFDFTVPLKLWWHHSINLTPYRETHRDALAIKSCIIESSMKKETWFIS